MDPGPVQQQLLLDALRGRLQRFERDRDVDAVLSPQAAALGEALGSTLAEPSVNLPVRQAVGLLNWYRCWLLPPAARHDSFVAAITFFEPVYYVRPNLAPRAVRDLFVQAAIIAGPQEMFSHAKYLLRYSATTDDSIAVNHAVDLLRRTAKAVPAEDPIRGDTLSALDEALQRRYERNGDIEDLHEAVEIGREALAAAQEGHQERVAALSNLSNSMGTRFERAGDQGDLEESIKLAREAVRRAPNDHPQRASILVNLGAALLSRGDDHNKAADIEEAVEVLRHAAAVCHPNDLGWHNLMSSLGLALRMRFGHTMLPAGLDEAVDVLRQAIDSLPPDHPGLSGFLANLSKTLGVRAAYTGSSSDLDEAVATARQALATSRRKNDMRMVALIALSTALEKRAARTDDLHDAEGAIASWRQVVDDVPIDHPDRPGLVAGLSSRLYDRIGRSGSHADIDEALAVARQALALTNKGPDTAVARQRVAAVLHALYSRTAAIADLNDAFNQLRLAIKEAPEKSAIRATTMASLSTVLLARYERLGDPSDLDAAVTAGEEAVDEEAMTTSADPLDASGYSGHVSLGNALRRRYERTAALSDLDQAIDVLRQAVANTPAHDKILAMVRSDLGAVLLRRFEHTGALPDLDEAIGHARQAVDARPPGHPDRARCLNNLGIALMARFNRTGERSDIDEAVQMDQLAVDGTPNGHPDRARREASLSNALQARFKHMPNPDDLPAAVNAARRALAALPADHSDRHRYRSTLSIALWMRYLLNRIDADLDEAVHHQLAAIEAVPRDHIGHAAYLVNLTTMYETRVGTTGADDDWEHALTASREAATLTTAPTHMRVTAARAWGRLAASALRWSDAAEGYATAVRLLSWLAPRSLGRADQEYWLVKSAGFGADAAACYLQAGQPEHAVEVWEQGRGVLIGQALDMRADLTALSMAHPPLAAEVVRVRDALSAVMIASSQGRITT